MASAAPLRRLAATGSLVKVMFGQAASMTPWGIVLPVSFWMPWLTSVLASAALALTKSLAATWPSRRRLTASGWSFRNAVRTMRWVVTYWPPGQRVFSSTRTLPLPSWTIRVAQGSGTQAPAMIPVLKASRAWPFSWGTMETSPPPCVSLLSPLALSQLRRATSWVLPSCGVAIFLPLRSAGLLMLGLTTR